MTKEMPLVSLIIGSNGKEEDLRRCLDSIFETTYSNIEALVLDDNSGNNLCDIISSYCENKSVVCIKSERSLGVSGSRNRLIKESRGEIIITLDDDAAIRDVESINNIVDVFDKNKDVGLIAFKIVDNVPDITRERVRVPFMKRMVKRHADLINQPRKVSYFVGTGHAVRREVYEKCGVYQENLFFDGEELDLSYRIIDAGYEMLYNPTIIIDHYPHPNSSIKITRTGYLFYKVRNKIWINFKYLPLMPCIINSFIWAVIILISSINKGEFVDVLKGIWAGISKLKEMPRYVVGSSAMNYMKKNYGRIYM